MPPSGGFFLQYADMLVCRISTVLAMNESLRISDRLLRRWPLLVPMLLCILVYFYGLFGGFLFDDFSSILQNPALRALDGSGFRWSVLALSSHTGPLGRPLSMLSFGLDYYLFGLSPMAFKITNLSIHLVNGVLLYALFLRVAAHLLPRDRPVRRLPEYISLLAASLWLLHPLNVGSVLYVVQRMNLLATLFTLAGLLCYTEGRNRMLRDEHGAMIAFGGICVFGILAVLSKENGALIVAYALVIESTCYHFSTPRALQDRLIEGFFWLGVALPLALFTAYLATHPYWLANGYAGRAFTLYERLLTEPRVLCGYLLWIFVPLPRWMGMFHDDIALSTDAFTPPTTAAAIAFFVALIVIAWRQRRRYPAIAFCVAWFLIGHAMESTIVPLELVFDHRNYLPMAGLLFGVIATVSPMVSTRFRTKQMVLAAGAIIVIFCGFTMSRAVDWGSELRLAMSEVANHPGSARAQYEAGRQIVFNGAAAGQREQAELEARPYFERAKALDTTDLFSASSLLIIHGRGGKAIAQQEVEDLAHRVRTILQPQINPFFVVQTAAIEGSISLPPEQMKLLIESALDNKAFPPAARAMILDNYGHYLFQVAHDNQSAVALTLAAAAEDPQNPLFQINLTKLALAMDSTDKASEYLAEAERLNKARLYDETIAALKQRIAAAKGRGEAQGAGSTN